MKTHLQREETDKLKAGLAQASANQGTLLKEVLAATGEVGEASSIQSHEDEVAQKRQAALRQEWNNRRQRILELQEGN